MCVSSEFAGCVRYSYTDCHSHQIFFNPIIRHAAKTREFYREQHARLKDVAAVFKDRMVLPPAPPPAPAPAPALALAQAQLQPMPPSQQPPPLTQAPLQPQPLSPYLLLPPPLPPPPLPHADANYSSSSSSSSSSTTASASVQPPTTRSISYNKRTFNDSNGPEGSTATSKTSRAIS